jgi:hypothetical protein
MVRRRLVAGVTGTSRPHGPAQEAMPPGRVKEVAAGGVAEVQVERAPRQREQAW